MRYYILGTHCAFYCIFILHTKYLFRSESLGSRHVK